MKAPLVLSMILATTLAAGSAHAAPALPKLGGFLRLAGGSIVIPPEWDGIWATVDSSSDCVGGPVTVEASEDTICGGAVYSMDPGEGGVEFTCSGTADATTMDITCTGGQDLFPDCHMTVTVHIVGTRTDETYHSVSTLETSTSGTAKGCDLFPSSCQRTATDGTRTAQTPPGYCTTPARRSTWGSVKAHYR
jgi:hypothetical protein